MSFRSFVVLLLVAACYCLLSAQETPLFDDEETLTFSLSGDIGAVLNDRGREPQYHTLEIQCETDDGPATFPLKVKTRGKFRRLRSNCIYPPLLLNFAKKSTPANTVFHGQDKLKLVTPCRGEKYVVREYLAYKIYQLATEYSFRARLVRFALNDTVKGKSGNYLYGILIEDEDEMAKRNGREIIKQDLVRPAQTNKEAFLQMAMFQFLIGNTDWSVQYRQNIKLLVADDGSLPIPVPYDFDHAGLVAAPYAKPAPELEMTSVVERRYRGYCLEDLADLDPVMETWQRHRSAIDAMISESPHLDARSVKSMQRFIEGFYRICEHPRRRKEAFAYPCNEAGTGNVVIRGLRDH